MTWFLDTTRPLVGSATGSNVPAGGIGSEGLFRVRVDIPRINAARVAAGLVAFPFAASTTTVLDMARVSPGMVVTRAGIHVRSAPGVAVATLNLGDAGLATRHLSGVAIAADVRTAVVPAAFVYTASGVLQLGIVLGAGGAVGTNLVFDVWGLLLNTEA